MPLGEADAWNPPRYKCLFPAMITGWRKHFHDGSAGETDAMFPFGFVQVSVVNVLILNQTLPFIAKSTIWSGNLCMLVYLGRCR